MAATIKIEGVHNVIQTIVGAPPMQSIVDDDDARQLRKDLTNGDAIWLTGCRIDNAQNETPAYVKFYDKEDPDVGVHPPAVVLRAKPGTITEITMRAKLAYLSYVVHAVPGKAGTDACANPVALTYGIFPA